MTIEVVFAIVGAVGILGFFAMLSQILRYFSASTRPTLIVAITGAVSLGIVDSLIITLFELVKATDLWFIKFVMSTILGSWVGMHLAIPALVREGSHETVVAMIDYQGSCVWILAGMLGGALGATIGGFSAGFSAGLSPFLGVVIGTPIGGLFGVPFLMVWIHLFWGRARVVSWAKRHG